MWEQERRGEIEKDNVGAGEEKYIEITWEQERRGEIERDNVGVGEEK